MRAGREGRGERQARRSGQVGRRVAGGGWRMGGRGGVLGRAGAGGQLLSAPKGRTQLGTVLRPIVLSSPIAVYSK